MKLYALLIGINEYPSKPLRQCVNDVRKMESYLTSLTTFDAIDIITLTNAEAEKENIVNNITNHLSKADDGDVALLYFSGHGAQEETAGLFPDEHDGLLECLVCYAKEDLSSNQMLADKELRYLFHQLPSNPHLVTVIDACHSGDIVRAYHQEENQPKEEVKRITGVFAARKYESFVFAEDKNLQKESQDGIIHIPFKNHVHVGACLSSESSWEDSKGGVFTRYLLQLLEATQNQIRYNDIARWAKISMKNVTKKQQTPIITIQGQGKIGAYSPWLNISTSGISFPMGSVTNNVKLGWIYSRGSLLGITENMQVLTAINGTEMRLPIKSVSIDHSVLEVPMEVISKMDFSKAYAAKTEVSTFLPLKLAINLIDPEETPAERVLSLLTGRDNVQVSDLNNADFSVNLFNGFAYISLPDHEFQPLARQIDLGRDDIGEMLNQQLRAIEKWHHFLSLENPGKDFEKCPIEVTITDNHGTTRQATNTTYRMIPQSDRLKNGNYYQKVRVDVKNISDEKLFIGVLTLGSDFSISSKPYDGLVIELGPGQSKTFYDHQQKKMTYASLEPYQEVYNWKEEWFYYKFIINNFEDFTDLLTNNDYLQPGLDPPLTIEHSTRTIKGESPRGEGGDMEEVVKKWGTCRTRIELANPSFNIISGDLKELWADYATSLELAPFIKELYFDDHFNGKNFEPRFKQNHKQSADEANRATDVWIVKLLNKLYNAARRRKFRRQRHQTGPVVVAEGDSWFLFPKPGVRDTLDYIMDHFRLLSLADAGDEIADYIKNNELLDAVSKEKPDYVLISGGGNDIVGAEIKDILKKDIARGSKISDFIDEDAFTAKMKFLGDGYRMFFERIKALQPEANILIHGYDYVRSNPDAKTIKKGWANRYMIEAKITNPEDRKLVITHLVDTFNTMLEGFTQSYKNVRYIDNRDTVGINEWMDEIHPNNVGYEKVANNFLKMMISQVDKVN